MLVGPKDVGRRVVLRHLLPDGRATDVLGELLSWDVLAGQARVATRQGEVTILLDTVVLGKPVPPAPAPRRRRWTPAQLHEVMAQGWAPLERERLGGWWLRAAEGFTGRANSVLPLGPPLVDGLPATMATAVDRAERWYGERGLPARFCVPWPLGAGPGDPADGSDPLERELVARGYELDTPTLVMTCSLAAGLRAESRWRADVQAAPDEGWLGLYHYRGQELPPVAVRVMTNAESVAFLSLRAPDGTVVAVARAASAQGWTGVSAVEVAPDQRRQGLATAVMEAALGWGRDQGDHSAYLQVARSNAAALALYDQLGLRPHSGYHYRVQPVAPVAPTE